MHRRITTRAGLSLIAALAIATSASACASSSQESGSGTTTTAADSTGQQGPTNASASPTAQNSSSSSGRPATTADCTVTYPATGRRGTVVVNDGNLTCEQAKVLIEKYLAQPVDGTSGNNTNHIQVDGWDCASPSATTAELQGIGTECLRGSDSIRVVLPGGSTAPHQVSAGAYMRDDGTAYQFSAGGGYWRCSIYTEESQPLAGCSGVMPSKAPQVLNAVRTKMTAPNGVELGSSGAGQFIASGDPRYFPEEHGGFITGTDLPTGRSLSVSVFTCTALAAGVQCENRNTHHGFMIERDNYRLW
ncbi:hypothetical protein ACPXB3_21065 [Gordonia sp. DT219]|uniref:hypothetical protein n=1 Tax=Gordonia sp. DT219 TaxID=3416658 RepID=UPI003CF17744